MTLSNLLHYELRESTLWHLYSKARISAKEYESFMRLAGIWRIKEIEISDLEINGQTSLY